MMLKVSEIRGQRKETALLERLKSQPRGRKMIFVDNRRQTENLAKKLSKAGFDSVHHYHAGIAISAIYVFASLLKIRILFGSRPIERYAI